MNKPVIVVVVVLVALVVLFAVGVTVGVTRDDGDASGAKDSALLDRLASVAGETADVEVAEMRADCDGLASGTLSFTGSCDLSVAPSSERMRLVRLKSAQPLTITAPAPEGDLDDIEADTDPNDIIRIAVGAGGVGDGTDRDEIELDCQAGVGKTCQVQVL